MGKSRTLKFLIDKGHITVGDSFKLNGYERIISEINDNFQKVNTNKGWFSFSEKVYPVKKVLDVSSVVSEEPTVSKNTTEFTISFSCKTDFEYVDKESKTMEEALEKARTMTPWQLILKSEPVDVQDSEVNIFGLISNEL
jgi:hypothetical protein